MATIFGALPIILQNGTLADANQVMADFNKIINDGNSNAAENGANSSITSLSGLTSPIPIAGGSSTHFLGSTSTGTATAQVVSTATPSNWALTTGFMISFNPGFSSTGATTLNVAGTGALAIRKASAAGPVALAANDIVSGQNATVVYDGTAYLLINEPNDPLFGTLTNLASAATTDLGTIQSQNVNVTGTTTITSFGSSASVANPYYLVTFAGALTLTYSATALIIPGSANLTTAAGDQALMEYLGSGNWKVAIYQKRDGTPIVSPAGTAGVLVNIQVFTASGTYTPTVGATTGIAIVTAPGGGGGASNGGSSTDSPAGGGGGSGSTTISYLSSLSTQAVTIGAAGGSGGAGGNASLGTITANGGGAGGTLAGGTGGAAGSGTLAIVGGSGGGGSSITSGGGVPNMPGGTGGASFWGGGGAGGNQAVGSAGQAFGSGGGGGGATGTTNHNGGSGAGGVIVVFEFK